LNRDITFALTFTKILSLILKQLVSQEKHSHSFVYFTHTICNHYER